MTITTSEREARELLAREYERDGQDFVARCLRYEPDVTTLERRSIRAIIAALTREQREVPPGLYDLDPYVLPQQEAPGAVASTIDAGGFISDTAALAFLRVIGGGNPNVEYAVERLRLSLITPPAPVDVRVALPKVTFKNVQRGDCGKYPDGTGWGHAWSAPIVEIERADWDRFIALLSGQPAGVCVYPDCNCPFDAPADPNWCARGLPKAARPQVELAELPVAFDRLPCEPDDDMIDVFTPTQMHAYAQQAIAESEARAEGLRKLLAEMIELRQATQDGRVTDRHELDIVRDAKAAIAQEAEREAGSA